MMEIVDVPAGIRCPYQAVFVSSLPDSTWRRLQMVEQMRAMRARGGLWPAWAFVRFSWLADWKTRLASATTIAATIVGVSLAIAPIYVPSMVLFFMVPWFRHGWDNLHLERELEVLVACRARDTLFQMRQSQCAPNSIAALEEKLRQYERKQNIQFPFEVRIVVPQQQQESTDVPLLLTIR